ncbi:MAG: DUF1801 domain-containing protein [Acidobacteria bacterium]|nr:MAG: DUF1801 domain-containing protein [Acidobacteriota bacterium]REK06274.1 MAG: DUF1801 domain-containing protein [Acidobacteriota bacterium]
MKPQKMKAYPSFAAWRRDQSAPNQRLIDDLASLVEETAPQLESTVKWGQGCWTLDGVPKAYIHAEPDHLQFGFYAGSTLDDPQGLLVGRGKHVRHVKVKGSEEIPREALVAFLQQVL